MFNKLIITRTCRHYKPFAHQLLNEFKEVVLRKYNGPDAARRLKPPATSTKAACAAYRYETNTC
jgi:hypothetical protein